jgi:hypothetical protein
MAAALAGAALASEKAQKDVRLDVGASHAWAAAQALTCRMATERPSRSPPNVRMLQCWRKREPVSGCDAQERVTRRTPHALLGTLART